MLSLDGKALTPMFAGYVQAGLVRDLENSESRTFTMSLKIPDAKAAAASLLKSVYLAMLRPTGTCRGGYPYVEGGALTPIRQRIMDPFKHSTIGEYVIKAPDDVSLKDIALVSEPLPCWILKITEQLVRFSR